MPATSDEQRRAKAARDRLAEIASRWHQAEIARRTGTSRTNISRYLKGTRMPLDFGTALVEQFGVNPAWLLTGEGTPMLADVSGATEKAAGNLLALVEAMSAVAKMRLGALAGKHHLRVLRELNDALERYEGLRRKLNAQTDSVYRELLDHYETALRKGRVEQAESLRDALAQVRRLCDDVALDRRFHAWQAFHEQFFGRHELAVGFQRQVFRAALPDPADVSERTLFETANFALTLCGSGRFQEARAVCRAMMALAMEQGLAGTAVFALEAAEALADAELGELARGMGVFSRALLSLSTELRKRLHGQNIKLQLYAGLVNYFSAIHLWPGDVQSPEMLRFAVWLEDPKVLEHACATWIGTGVKEHPRTLVAGYAVALHEAQAGRMGGWRAFVQERLLPVAGGAQDSDAFTAAVYAARLMFAAGEIKQAKAQLAVAARVLSALPAGVSPLPLVLGSYWRSVLETAPRGGEQAREAAEFFRVWLGRGFGCFEAHASSER